jgi:hypothetical protein
MARDLARKLRLTSLVLGCTGRKDFCARFRAVNPATQVDLDRAHKWMQGRAEPRSPQVYDDWARVLGTTRSGSWLAECALEAFETELGALFRLDPEALRRRMEAESEPGQDARPDDRLRSGDEVFDLAGHYACYSHAWSPYYRGQIIRGALTIEPPRRGLREVRYTERLLGTEIVFRGEVIEAVRTLHLVLRAPAGVSPLFMSLVTPGPPGSVLSGIMSGATAVGPEPLPSATRMVVVRVPTDAAPSNRYFLPSGSGFADDLAALGLGRLDPVAVQAALADALGRAGAVSGLDQVARDQITALSLALDVAWLDQARRAPAEDVVTVAP